MAKKRKSGSPPAAGAKKNASGTKKQGAAIAKKNKDRHRFGDPSDLLAAHYSIQLFHVPTGTKVKFKGWVTNFNDSYQSNWNTEDTYGRMDPITTFQNTTRVITVEWDVIAAHKTEAKDNMANCEKLFKMLYPTYSSGADSAGSLSGAPIFKLKFGNLISKAGEPAIADVSTAGLMGTMGGFEYSPDFDAGFFLESGAMYPQTISLSAEFQVIHNFQVGWSAETGMFRANKFPYGTQDDGYGMSLDPRGASSGGADASGASLPDFTPTGMDGGMSMAPPESSTAASRQKKKAKAMTSSSRGKK